MKRKERNDEDSEEDKSIRGMKVEIE